MVLEAYVDTPGEAEKWTALAAAVLTTQAQALLDEANKITHRHNSGDYATRSLYNAFHLSEGLLDTTGNSVFRYTLQFQVTGQLILERTFTGSAEVISKIFSPGHKDDTGPVSIEANLD